MLDACINGINCKIYCDERISPEDAPSGYPYMYHIRHDDSDWTRPIMLEQAVFVNFFGTVFMRQPIEIGDSGYLEIESFSMERQLIEFKLRSKTFEMLFCLP